MTSRYLSQADRIKIENLYSAGAAPLSIAAELQVRHSTIYRELKKGYTGATDKNGRPEYSAALAEQVTQERKSNRRYAPQRYTDMELLRWRFLHPHGLPAHCSKDIGISKTVLSYRWPQIYCTKADFFAILQTHAQIMSEPEKVAAVRRKALFAAADSDTDIITEFVRKSHPQAVNLLEEPDVFNSIWNEYKAAEQEVINEISDELNIIMQDQNAADAEELRQFLFESRLQQLITTVKLQKVLGEEDKLAKAEKDKYLALRDKVEKKGLEAEYLEWKENYLKRTPWFSLLLKGVEE